MGEPEPVFGCHIQDCASETSYPADMLAVAGDYVICEECYKEQEAYWVDSGVGLYVPWHELPRFIPKADQEIAALQAQVAELKKLRLQVKKLETQLHNREQQLEAADRNMRSFDKQIGDLAAENLELRRKLSPGGHEQ